jgi:hypothetical protein
VGLGNYAVGGVGESEPVVAHHVTPQHPEHFRSGTLDNCYPGQQRRSHVKPKDRTCGRGQVLLFRGNDTVEIGDDCAEHSEAPKVVLAGYRSWNASHQEKPSDFGRRYPGSDTTFGLVVEQLFAPNGRIAILPERGGEFVPLGVPEQTSADRTGEAPANQLASQGWLQFRATGAAVWARSAGVTTELSVSCMGIV